jgi:uncharacterized membrane protein (DUF2068 family)
VSQTINPKSPLPAAPAQTMLALEHKAPLGLRTVAVFELAKGVFVLLIGLYLLSLVGKDVEAEASNLLRLVRLDPAWHISKWLMDAAGKLTDHRLYMFALIAAVYCVVRVVEAFGLWHEYHWAEWFAVVSAGLYMPVEIYHIIRHATPLNVTFFLSNVALVIYLGSILAANHRRKMILRQLHPQPAPAKS